MFDDILYEASAGIATITINRPKVRNAVRPKTYEELTEAMKMAADDPEVGVVVLTGAGDKAFSSGRRRQRSIEPQALYRPHPHAAPVQSFLDHAANG